MADEENSGEEEKEKPSEAETPVEKRASELEAQQ